MLGGLVVTGYPLLWMLFGSLKDAGSFYDNIWGIGFPLKFSNYVDAWNAADLGQKFVNSIVVTAGALLLVLAISSMAGYAIARVKYRMRWLTFGVVMLGIMVPFGVIAMPVFTVVSELGLLNSRIGLILVYTAQALPLGTFLMFSFFLQIPKELEEAAYIDGSTPFGAFWRVILPLARPGLLTQVIFSGTTIWNEYFMASILITKQDLQTLPVGLVTFTSRFTTDFPQLFAALVMVSAPLIILFLLAQKWFIAGLSAGAVKG